jgi:hypothetical protein
MPPRAPRLARALVMSLLLHIAGIAALTTNRPAALPPAIDIQYVQAAPSPRDEQLPDSGPPEESGFDPAPLVLDDFAINADRIRSRLSMLFPFLTLDVQFLAQLPSAVVAAAQTLRNPYPPGTASSPLPPLAMSDKHLQETIDAAWSRRERWRTFATMAGYLDTHSAHEGRAAELVREYLDQNILQPYCDGATRDPRYWAMMENAADHVDFIDFIRSFARRSPSSKTTTELLFLLDELAQGSLDVMIMVVETRPDEDLTTTRNVAPDAYALAVEIKERYGQWLAARGWNKGEVRRHYNALRLRLLETIVATAPHGYRLADAQYLAGQVLFEMNRLDEAVRVWRSIAPIPGDAYFRAYSEMLDALGDGPPDVSAIRRVISREYGRWRVFSIDRLHEFGHHCDSF